MTSNQLKKLAESHNLDLQYVTSWGPPAGNDLRPLIAMPNLPKMIHGRGMQPRTILRPSEWDAMRKACYEDAGFKCEICGVEVGVDIPKRQLHAHECFVIDYEKGTATFIGCFATCMLDHIGAIHSGRCLTLWKDKNPLYPTEFLLAGAEKAFTIISSYNRDHPEADLRAYSTFIEYLKHDELREPMLELIKKYDIKFYMEDPRKMAKWGDWRLIFNGEEYPTPYKNEKEWKKAMEEAGKNDSARIYATKKKKFIGIDSVTITDEDLEKINNAEIPEGF